MSTLIRTDDVAGPDRYEFMRDVLAATWVPMDCRVECRWPDYSAEFRASGLGPMQPRAAEALAALRQDAAAFPGHQLCWPLLLGAWVHKR